MRTKSLLDSARSNWMKKWKKMIWNSIVVRTYDSSAYVLRPDNKAKLSSCIHHIDLVSSLFKWPSRRITPITIKGMLRYLFREIYWVLEWISYIISWCKYIIEFFLLWFSHKNHRNGIYRPKKQRNMSQKGVSFSEINSLLIWSFDWSFRWSLSSFEICDLPRRVFSRTLTSRSPRRSNYVSINK